MLKRKKKKEYLLLLLTAHFHSGHFHNTEQTSAAEMCNRVCVRGTWKVCVFGARGVRANSIPHLHSWGRRAVQWKSSLGNKQETEVIKSFAGESVWLCVEDEGWSRRFLFLRLQRVDRTQISGGKDLQGVYEERPLLLLTLTDLIHAVTVRGLSCSKEKCCLPVPISQFISLSLQAIMICWYIM